VNPPPPLPASDVELLELVAGGNRHALSRLYEEHGGWLAIRLERRCGDPELADLALQDTFVAVWKSASSFRGEGDVGAWLWGIAVRRLVDQLRKIKRDVTTEPPAPEPSAEQTALDRSLSGPVASAVARLEPELRTVFLAANLDGLTTREIAVLHDIPQGTVKTRIARARRRLRADLEPVPSQEGHAA